MNIETLDFSISRYRFLDEEGKLCQPLPEHLTQTDLGISAYQTMVLARTFDSKAIALQRTGKLGTYPSILGQEAIGTAIGLAMHENDVFAPYYRDLTTQYLRGVQLEELLLYWGGDERGSDYQNCPQDFPICVPIATQLCHAAGAAIGLKVQGIHRAALVTCGEGATSKGDFLETLNLAGDWQLPLVVVVNNNQWAISTPRNVQTGSETIAQKAIGAGVTGIQVDGNDFFSVFYAVNEALSKAYAGKGATLIEAVSYRLGDHTTADDASRYRSAEELKQAWKREPIKRLQQYLVAQGVWSPEQEQALIERVTKEVDEAVKAYLSYPPQKTGELFEYLYETLPEPLRDQCVEARYAHLNLGGR